MSEDLLVRFLQRGHHNKLQSAQRHVQWTAWNKSSLLVAAAAMTKNAKLSTFHL